ncbi:MAG: hypothetical protein GW947_04425 [Candidatus Pacebacteria bacterium]|nr:hypothetical protein [Candidatus Paceibacterota bacterium]
MRIDSPSYTGFVFGEGKNEKNFLIALIDLEQFKYQTKLWEFNYDNGHGCSAKDILIKCKNSIIGRSYDVVLCFIDLDDLKHDYPSTWENEKEKLEKFYKEIIIRG